MKQFALNDEAVKSLQDLVCCGNKDCEDFVPNMSLVLSTSAQTVTITDTSAFGAGDDLENINIQVSDRAGNVIHKHIKTAGGNVEVDVSKLNPDQGYYVLATVVSNKGCIANLSVDHLGFGTSDASVTFTGEGVVDEEDA